LFVQFKVEIMQTGRAERKGKNRRRNGRLYFLPKPVFSSI